MFTGVLLDITGSCDHFSNSLVGSFGKGSLQKMFCKFSAKFPQTFHRILALFPDAMNRVLQISAKIFRKTLSKNPFANEPISELLTICHENITPLIRITSNRVAVKERFDKDRGPRRVMSRNSHRDNRYRVIFWNWIESQIGYLKKSGGATPEVEKPPRASRRKIAP